jgi:hypothetical protein
MGPQDKRRNAIELSAYEISHRPLRITSQYLDLLNQPGLLDNTAIGSNRSQTFSHHTFDGYYALSPNTTGNRNTAIGSSTLSTNTTGNYNGAVGSIALSTNTTGTRNTALGTYALSTNTTGTRNTAIGTYSY